jgi:hypothetical protein
MYIKKIRHPFILYFLYLTLVMSFMHAVLRLNESSHFSLYIIMMPFTLFILILGYKKSKKPIIFLILLILYNLLIGSFYSENFSYMIVMFFHYISILNIFLIVHYIYNIKGFDTIYNILYKFFLLSIFTAILEIIFEFRLPNTAIYYDGSVSAFNWNQNELGTILLSFVPFLLVFEKTKIKLILILCIVYIVYINDSKLVLIGMIIAILLYMIKKNIFEVNVYFKYIALSLFAFLFILLFFLPYDEIYVSFRDYDISLYTLLGMPISHILTLTPFPDIGDSDTTRANAIIYGITDLINSNFFGIGAGNSLLMLEKPEYMLKTAKSMHNLPTQFVVEQGIFILIIYIYVFILFFILLIKQNLTNIQLVIFISIPSIFIGSMGSSIGIFSDYFFFASIFLMIMEYTNKKENI